MPSRFLLIEDSEIDATVVQNLLCNWIADRGGILRRARSLAEFEDQVRSFSPHVIIVDLNIIDSYGLATFRHVRDRMPQSAIVVLSGIDDFEVAREAVREGASDYLVKQHLSSDLLVRSCRFAFERTHRARAERRLAAATHELEVARQIQSYMTPHLLPTVKGLELAGGTCAVGYGSGDYLDALPLPDGRLLLAVGDVSGHGIGPALIMMEIRACIRALLRSGCSLRETVAALAHALTEDLPPDSFATLLVSVLNPISGRMDISGFGASAFILRMNRAWEQIEPTQPILTARGDGDAVAHETHLSEGEILVAFTDGLTCIAPKEGRQLGEADVLDRIAAVGDGPLDAIWRNICLARSTLRDAPPDDATGLLVRRTRIDVEGPMP